MLPENGENGNPAFGSMHQSSQALHELALTAQELNAVMDKLR